MLHLYRQHSCRDLCLSVISVALICDTTGIIGTLLYNQNKNNLPNSGTILALSLSNLITTIAIPIAFIKSKRSHFYISLVILISCCSILGAGLSYINLTLMKNDIRFPSLVDRMGLFKAFNSMSIVSTLSIGLLLGFLIRPITSEPDNSNPEQEEEQADYKFICSPHPKNVVSMKASAATLVDSTDNIADNNSSVALNSLSRMGIMSRRQDSVLNDVNYSIKKLSVINQSTSSTDIMNMSKNSSEGDINSQYLASTRALKKSISPSPSKSILVERDAIKRIPSVLLPPHLRPQEKTALNESNSSSRKLDPSKCLDPPIPLASDSSKLPHPLSFMGYRRESIPEDEIMQQIPRSSTLQEMFPYRARKANNGLRTISLEDWGGKGDWIQQQSALRTQTPCYNVLKREIPSFGSYPGEETTEQLTTFCSHASDTGDCDRDIVNPLAREDYHSSTGEVFRYMSTQGTIDIYEGGIDQSFSTLHLDDLYKDQTSIKKTKTHSPTKSIFGVHSQKSSMNSFTFKQMSASVPVSPRKKSRSAKPSPKKMRIKNLSLSSIVFKDEDEIPNFSYVHELQRSPSRRPSMMNNDAKNPMTPVRRQSTLVLDKKEPATPESGNSNNSFPSEVLGMYDREKWKTLERLNMVNKA